MSFFKKVVSDLDSLKKDFLGPDYKYYDFIKTPDELEISGDGTIPALTKDVAGIVNYVQLLIAGTGRANKKGQPLGSKFFLKTGGQCKDYKTGKVVTRSMYIYNVPSGAIPLVTGLTGFRSDNLKGLVPGVVDNMMEMNPLKMFSAFMEGSEPLCAEVTLPVIGEDGNNRIGKGFVPINELKDLANRVKEVKITPQMKKALNNGVTKETFQNIITNNYYDFEENMKGDNIDKDNKKLSFDKIYYLSVSILFMYLLYKMLLKR